MSASTVKHRNDTCLYNRYAGHSETGLRGLTAIPATSGKGEVLLAAVEGSAARIVRVDPRDGGEITEIDLPGFLRQHWGCRPATSSPPITT